ncbi:Bestrophin, RFP-TM, chloride channel-domain-containing protein [Blastocladiella britannica]|nr:Bestrophin, RFP-TM, chloride channel-domain-containing protein [Blastocladiella britannica]
MSSNNIPKSSTRMMAYVGVPDAFQLHGSVLLPVMFPTILTTLWAIAVSAINELVCEADKAGRRTCFSLAPSNNYITLTGFVLSLMLAFKNNTSYEKYSEGRKLWATMLTASRNLSRMVWIGVKETTPEDHEQKSQTVRLILAIFVALKNHLRQESGFIDENGALRLELVNLMPEAKRQLLLAQHRDTIAQVAAGPDGRRPSAAQRALQRMDSGYLALNDTHIVIDLCHMLAAWINSQNKSDKLDASQFGTMNVLTNTMLETITSLERVATSKVPHAYRVHLKQFILLWLVLLPFQIVQTLGLVITPLMTALVTFTFLGLDAIGNEIEMPFGYDTNDLPLDQFCTDLAAELNELLSSDVTELAFWGHASSTAIDMVAVVTVPAPMPRDISVAPAPLAAPVMPPKPDHTTVPVSV